MKRSISINMLLKPISMFISLLYTPLLLSYLGSSEYGIWTTIMSVINWINLFDLGIGNGLRNELAKEIGLGKYNEAKKSISTGYTILTILIFFVFVIVLVVGLFVNWNSVFNTDLNIDVVLLISFSFICINFILSLQSSAYYALQKSEIVAIIGTGVQLINLLGILSLFLVKTDKLISIACLFGLSSVIVNIFFSIILWKKSPFLKPNYKLFDKHKLKSICDLGFKFFLIQIAIMVLYSTDSIIITQLFSSSDVTPYNTAYKAFGSVFSLFYAFLTPYWSRFTLAYSRKEYAWIENTLKKFKLIWLGSIVILLVLVPFFPIISYIWLGVELQYDTGLILAMAIYYIFYIYNSIYSTVMNGMGKINVQMVSSIIGAIINVPLSIFLARECGLRTTGVCIATIICLLMNDVAYTIQMKVMLKKWKLGRAVSK